MRRNSGARRGPEPFRALLALTLLAAAPAGADTLAEDARLARILELHGWACDRVVGHRPLTEGWQEVRCADGSRYEIRLGPGRSDEAADRRTRLRELFDEAQETPEAVDPPTPGSPPGPAPTTRP